MRHPIEQTTISKALKTTVTLVIEGAQRTIACESCTIADTPSSRMRGLLGKKRLLRGEGILLQPAASIHTAFMRFTIDAVFLNAHLEVVGIMSNMRPWRAVSCRGAKAVLELAAGEAVRRGLKVGDRLLLLEAPPAIDVDLAGLFERVGAMLANNVTVGHPGWDEVELLLTEGYAQTLALESERLRIERRIADRAASRRRKRSPQTRSLAARHEAVNRDIACLRALLEELYDYGRPLRDARSRGEASSRAA